MHLEAIVKVILQQDNNVLAYFFNDAKNPSTCETNITKVVLLRRFNKMKDDQQNQKIRNLSLFESFILPYFICSAALFKKQKNIILEIMQQQT